MGFQRKPVIAYLSASGLFKRVRIIKLVWSENYDIVRRARET